MDYTLKIVQLIPLLSQIIKFHNWTEVVSLSIDFATDRSSTNQYSINPTWEEKSGMKSCFWLAQPLDLFEIWMHIYPLKYSFLFLERETVNPDKYTTDTISQAYCSSFITFFLTLD